MCKPFSVALTLCFKKLGLQSVPRWLVGIILLLSVTDIAWDFLWMGLDQCHGCVPSQPFASSLPPGFEGLLKRVLMLWQHCLAIAKHGCSANTVLATSAEHSTAWAAVGNVMPARPIIIWQS